MERNGRARCEPYRQYGGLLPLGGTKMSEQDQKIMLTTTAAAWDVGGLKPTFRDAPNLEMNLLLVLLCDRLLCALQIVTGGVAESFHQEAINRAQLLREDRDDCFLSFEPWAFHGKRTPCGTTRSVDDVN
jgi:hypothetical protein